MDQEGHASASKKKRKIEGGKLSQLTSVQNVDDNTVDKSVCAKAVDLTTDAWLLVFSYLDIADKTRIARVCKRWRELARISWKIITRLSINDLYETTSIPPHKWTDDLLGVFLRQCGTRLRCLDLSDPYYYRHHRLTSHALDLIGLYCTSLQDLILSHIKFHSGNTALTTLADKFPRLRSLSLSYCEGIDDDVLRGTLRILKSLKSLEVFVQNKIINARKAKDNVKITGDFLSQAPQSLTEVIMQGCYHLTDEGVRLLAKNCPNLETIDLCSCRKVTGQTITDLAENCPKLKKFEFSRNNSGSVLTSHLLTLSKFPLLEEVCLEDETAVTDQVFYELGRNCPLLRSVSCAGCEELTDAALLHLSPCQHLENIDLNCCYGITDEGLIQLSSAHTELKKVYLIGCAEITVEGVDHLLSGHPNLLELEISRGRSMTDRLLPILESSLQRREHSQPLKLRLEDTYFEFDSKDKVWTTLRKRPDIQLLI